MLRVDAAGSQPPINTDVGFRLLEVIEILSPDDLTDDVEAEFLSGETAPFSTGEYEEDEEGWWHEVEPDEFHLAAIAHEAGVDAWRSMKPYLRWKAGLTPLLEMPDESRARDSPGVPGSPFNDDIPF